MLKKEADAFVILRHPVNIRQDLVCLLRYFRLRYLRTLQAEKVALVGNTERLYTHFVER